uniref:DUF2795 domain-containing protein n=1 Tax=Thermosporothrix sp. COM3 TaxID=2490863 RepID=A0A455SUH6_9CHLR|nr:hypothetical protein KTC_55720 [Thermosporothrix sp. COM3]
MAKINPIQAEKFLKGVNYPASKKDLVDCAKKNKADENVCDVLEQLPEQNYNKPSDVSKAIGAINREER